MKTKLLTFTRDPFWARGFQSRTVALIASVAMSVCTAVRLDAVVIDDFEGPVKFLPGDGGTDYFRWGLTNGQLVVSKQSPIPTPTPPSDVRATYDNVYWPDSLPGGSLRNK